MKTQKTQIKLNLSRASADQRESALQNACSFSEMDDNTALKILELLKKSGNDTVLAGQKDKLMSECKEFLRSQISTGKTVYLCYDHLAQSVPNHLP